MDQRDLPKKTTTRMGNVFSAVGLGFALAAAAFATFLYLEYFSKAPVDGILLPLIPVYAGPGLGFGIAGLKKGGRCGAGVSAIVISCCALLGLITFFFL